MLPILQLTGKTCPCYFLWSCILNFAEDSFNCNETDVLQVTRLMLLAVDSGILPLKVEPEIIEPCMTEIVLTLTNIIVSIPNHPYMSYHKAERAVEIIISLLREAGSLEGKFYLNTQWNVSRVPTHLGKNRKKLWILFHALQARKCIEN